MWLWTEYQRFKHLHRQTEKILGLLMLMEISMSAQLDALTAQVALNKSLTDSILAVVNGLAAQIEAAKTDPVALQALADSLKSDDDKIAAAIQANTPPAA